MGKEEELKKEFDAVVKKLIPITMCHQPGGCRSNGVSWCIPMVMESLSKRHRMICL